MHFLSCVQGELSISIGIDRKVNESEFQALKIRKVKESLDL